MYGIALDRKPLRQARVGRWGDGAGAGNTVFASLANGRPQAGINNRTWISDVVLRLLNASMSTIIGFGTSHEDAISLVGRALFTRFLGDRGLLPEHMAEPETAATLFDTPDRAEETSAWLDDTFNGDLLPLSPGDECGSVTIHVVEPRKHEEPAAPGVRKRRNGHLGAASCDRV